MPSLVSSFQHLPVLPMGGLFFALLVVGVWFFSTENQATKRMLGIFGGGGFVVLIGWILALTVLRPLPELHEVGGATFVLVVQGRQDDQGKELSVVPSDVDACVGVLKKRLDAGGVRDVLIQTTGGNQIEVVLPGLDPAKVPVIRKMLTTRAELSLREVHQSSDESGAAGKSLAQRVADGTELVPGYRVLFLPVPNQEGSSEKSVPLLVKRTAALTGADIEMASPSPAQKGAVDVTLTSRGSDKMIAFTKNMIPGLSRIAIVIDDEVVSAPVVNQVPLGRRFIVEGFRETGEVQTLANLLITPLESPLVLKEVRTVSPKIANQ